MVTISLCSSYIRNAFGTFIFYAYLCTAVRIVGNAGVRPMNVSCSVEAQLWLKSGFPTGFPTFPFLPSTENYCFCAIYANFTPYLTFITYIMNRKEELTDSELREILEDFGVLCLTVITFFGLLVLTILIA